MNVHLKNVKHHITKLLPEQEEVALVFTGTKLGTKFNIKDKTSKEHQHNLTYSVSCPDCYCNERHNDETGRRLIETVHVFPHVFKHSIEANDPTIILDDFRVLKAGYLRLYSSNRINPR